MHEKKRGGGQCLFIYLFAHKKEGLHGRISKGLVSEWSRR